MKQIFIACGSTGSLHFRSGWLLLRPVALVLAGLQLLILVGASVESVAQCVSATDALAQDNVAENLHQAAGLVQIAKSYATGLATGTAWGAIGKSLSQFGTAQVILGLDQNLKSHDSSLNMLVPLYDSP